jgi:hypothetical protein
MPEQGRNRKDHILPQGYLDGFTGPDGFLHVYDISAQKWSFRSKTENVACERAFYDYSKDVNPDQTADQAFQEYEDYFPNLRREMVATNFSRWKRHLPFLFRYINQLRVRSRLFRQHVLQSFEQTPPMVVGEVVIHSETGRTGLKLKPMAQTGKELETAHNNLSISKMRADLLNVPPFFYDFDWCLRTTADINRPVIIADEPIRLEIGSQERPYQHFETRIWFPLCWQACLIGSPKPQLPNTKAFSQDRLSELRQNYLRTNCMFAYSPVVLT